MPIPAKTFQTSSSPEVIPMSKPYVPNPSNTDEELMPNDHDPIPAANQPNGEPMTKTRTHQTAPNDRTGGLMTEIAKPAAKPDHPHGAPMPNTESSSAVVNPNGEPMTETQTDAIPPDNPNPEGPMAPDLPSDDEPERTESSLCWTESVEDYEAQRSEPIPDTLRMIAPEDVARAALDSIVGSLGRDEVRVLTRIAERLQVGSQMYGPFYLATDARVFRDKEAREELEDALVYLACAWLKTETREVA